ncbi:hypothetical protein ACQP00_20645 [Dactylosporangium sp. CS-047395]|uniref:hypothetical protein n=1 Tax=Dactylosporangium sp. CS-047395 TaxID=3239936 RepID=UPI003D8E2BCE
MFAAVEARLGEAEVRDVSLLPVPPLTAAAGHASPAAWAAAEYQLLRTHVVDIWSSRLAAALHDGHLSSGDGEQLLLIVGWPIVNEPDREIAYPTQYPVLADAVVATRYSTPIPAPQAIPQAISQAVVLRVPASAAGHAVAHRSDYLHAVPGASVATGAVVHDRDVRVLLRSAAGYLPHDDVGDPAGPLAPVAAWRAAAGPATDLRAWATEHGGHHWNLPQRWRWIPADTPRTGGLGSAALLQQLCQALRSSAVVLVLAAGEHDALDRVELLVCPEAVDPDTGALTYRPHDLPGCPTITVPWRRIIARRASPVWPTGTRRLPRSGRTLPRGSRRSAALSAIPRSRRAAVPALTE